MPFAWPDKLVSRAVTENPHALLPEKNTSAHLGREAADQNQDEAGKPMKSSRRAGPVNPIRQTCQQSPE